MRIENPEIYIKIKQNVVKEGDTTVADPFPFGNFVKLASKKSNG